MTVEDETDRRTLPTAGHHHQPGRRGREVQGDEAADRREEEGGELRGEEQEGRQAVHALHRDPPL